MADVLPSPSGREHVDHVLTVRRAALGGIIGPIMGSFGILVMPHHPSCFTLQAHAV